MQRLHADLATYAFICAIGGVVMWQTRNLPNPFGGPIGTGTFPFYLAAGMIGLSLIGALRAVLAADGARLSFPGGRKIIVTILSLVAFFGLWRAFGHFFPLAFVFLAGLLIYYASDERLTAKLVTINLVAAGAFILAARWFFTVVLYVRF